MTEWIGAIGTAVGLIIGFTLPELVRGARRRRRSTPSRRTKS